MSERLCAVGGGLELRSGAHGFCLVATVPAAPVVSASAGVTVTT
jgi:signal transduction histidine kinase